MYSGEVWSVFFDPHSDRFFCKRRGDHFCQSKWGRDFAFVAVAGPSRITCFWSVVRGAGAACAVFLCLHSGVVDNV